MRAWDGKPKESQAFAQRESGCNGVGVGGLDEANGANKTNEEPERCWCAGSKGTRKRWRE